MQEEINSTETTEERLGTKDQDVAVKLWELSVDPAGGRWKENHVREDHAVTNNIANRSAQIDLLYSFHTHFLTSLQCGRRHFFLHEAQCCHKQVTKGSHAWSRGQSCDWKWQKRITGPAEGESGRPAEQNQLVSGPAGPAPSVSHLLAPLGSMLILSTFLTIQRLRHSVL